jgi:hypothetical protein
MTCIFGASLLTHQCRGREPFIQALADADALAAMRAATTSVNEVGVEVKKTSTCDKTDKMIRRKSQN